MWKIGWCGLICLLLSCGGKDSKSTPKFDDPGEAAISYYQFLLKGDYARFVDGMESCDKKTPDFRNQMITLVKQNCFEEKEDNGGLTSVSVAKIQKSEDGKSANVLLNVSYQNGTIEEIELVMIYVSGKWRMM